MVDAPSVAAAAVAGGTEPSRDGLARGTEAGMDVGGEAAPPWAYPMAPLSVPDRVWNVTVVLPPLVGAATYGPRFDAGGPFVSRRALMAGSGPFAGTVAGFPLA